MATEIDELKIKKNKIKHLRKRMFKTYSELWDLTLEVVIAEETDMIMTPDFLRKTLRLMWTDGTLRTDEDQDFLTSFEQELKSSWDKNDQLRTENDRLKKQLEERK